MTWTPEQKRKLFDAGIMTGAIVRSIQDSRSAGFAVDVVQIGMAIPTEAIPDNVNRAALDWLDYNFRSGAEPPEWLPDTIPGTEGW